MKEEGDGLEPQVDGGIVRGTPGSVKGEPFGDVQTLLCTWVRCAGGRV